MKKSKQFLLLMVMIVSMMMMVQLAFADAENIDIGVGVYAIDKEGYSFFKINNNYGTNNITIATYGSGEFQLIWLGNNEIYDRNTYEIKYAIDSAIKACVDNAAAHTTRTHMGNVCLKGQQISSGWNYFAIKNNSKDICPLLIYTKIGANGKDAPFDVSIADDVNPAPAKSADCLNNASKEGYECKHELTNKYYIKNALGVYNETSSLEIPDTALGHKLDTGTVLTASTCQHNGELEKHCIREGCIYTIKSSIALDPNNHEWDKGVVTKQSTYSEEGIKTYKCIACGKEKTEILPKLTASLQTQGAAIGATLSVAGAKYRIISVDCVEYTAPEVQTGSTVIPTTVTINEKQYNVTSIAANAFKNNNKLKKVTIPNGIVMIGAYAFQGCKNLTKVVIPASVKSIGKKAFNGCKKLKNIQIKSQSLTNKSVGTKAFSNIHAKATVRVPKKVKKVYTKMLKKKGLKGKTQKIK